MEKLVLGQVKENRGKPILTHGRMDSEMVPDGNENNADRSKKEASKVESTTSDASADVEMSCAHSGGSVSESVGSNEKRPTSKEEASLDTQHELKNTGPTSIQYREIQVHENGRKQMGSSDTKMKELEMLVETIN